MAALSESPLFANSTILVACPYCGKLFPLFFFQTVSIAVSVMTLCAISVERWYAICHPLRFHSTLRRTRFTIIAIWLISICVAVPEVVSAVVVCPRNDTILHSYCYPGLMSDEMIQSFQVSIMVVFYFIPLCLMGYTYSHIAVVLWRQKIPGLNFEGNFHIRKKQHSSPFYYP